MQVLIHVHAKTLQIILKQSWKNPDASEMHAFCNPLKAYSGLICQIGYA